MGELEVGNITNPANPPEPFNTIWYTSTNVQDARCDHDYQDERRSRPQWRPNHSYGPRSYSRDNYRRPQVNQVHQNRFRSLSRNRNRRYSGNANNPPNNNQIICDWCGNPGHIQRYCRRKLGLCLRCGSNQHRLRDCPKPSRYSQRNQPQQNSNVNFGPQRPQHASGPNMPILSPTAQPWQPSPGPSNHQAANPQPTALNTNALA